MNIVHIAPNSPYNEGWGYQDNLLPKYQAKLGHNVTLIITNREHSCGKIVSVEPIEYKSENGFYVIRKEHVPIFNDTITAVLGKLDIYDTLKKLKPDYVFFHGLESVTIFQVTKYKKKENPNLIIVQDNHADFNLGYTWTDGIKPFLLCLKNKIVFQLNKKYVNKVFGVTPWRREYAEKVVGVPKTLSDVLIMGADDEKIDFAAKNSFRTKIRNCYNIPMDKFLIITGGKIDAKKNIDKLMEVCAKRKDVHLLVFGEICDDVKEKVTRLADKADNIDYIGWIKADNVYEYFFAADLAFFPGQHSVLWEQACASKIPAVFLRWDGMDHVNNGGNSSFIDSASEENISTKIDEMVFTEKYYKMLEIATSSKTDIYLYSNIALKSLKVVEDRS